MTSLRRQLLAGILGSLALVLAIAGTALFAHIRRAVVTEFDSALAARANGLLLVVEQTRKKVDVDLKDKFIPEFQPGAECDYYEIRQIGGPFIARSPSLDVTRDLPGETGPLGQFYFFDLPLPDGRRGRAAGIVFQPRLDLGKNNTDPPPARVTLRLVVATDRARLDKVLASSGTGFALAGIAALAASALGIFLAVRRALAPVQRVAGHAASLTERSLGVEFPVAGMPREIVPVCHRLNELMSRLGAAFERESRFSSDIAHELRTPLAELRTLCETALRWPGGAEESEATIREAAEITLRMERLVTTLLAIARSERGAAQSERAAVALAGLVHEILEPLLRQMVERLITVTVGIPESLTVTTDPALLRVILSNLLANAGQHTPRSGMIRIAATGGSILHVTISNTCAGLSEADIPRLFERFWRKDEARPSSERCGLGLALAAACAKSLGCDLSASLPAPDTIVFTLSIPQEQRAGLPEFAPAVV